MEAGRGGPGERGSGGDEEALDRLPPRSTVSHHLNKGLAQRYGLATLDELIPRGAEEETRAVGEGATIAEVTTIRRSLLNRLRALED